MKRLLPLLVLFCVFGAVACSSDSSDKSTEGSDSVELTMQSDTNELEDRIAALEAQLANLPAGPAGPAGADGTDGTDGAVGPQGPAGADGTDGAVGPQGPAGATGATGDAGATGATGATGSDGAQGLQGETGAAGSDGALSGLTCDNQEFVATLSGSWQCAALGVTQGGSLSGTVITAPATNCCNIGEWVNDGYSAVGLDTNLLCNDFNCEFSVVGIPDHSICSLTGSIGNTGFTQTSAGVNVMPDKITVSWTTVTGQSGLYTNNGGESLSVQLQCGQGVVAAD